MKFKPYVIPATQEHCDYIAANLREIDRKEIWASSGFMPQQALNYSLKTCPVSYAAINPKTNNPVLIFGVGKKQSIISDKRCIWMLATDEIYSIKTTFLKECNSYINQIGAGSKVFNYVIEGNDVTLKWLHWLGFTIIKPKPHGLIGKNFHYVEKDLSCVNPQQPV